MELLWKLIKRFWFILILTLGIGQELTGCMDDGYQQGSPNFGSPACNYNQDAIVEGECLYNDCLGNCPEIIENGIWDTNPVYTNEQYDDCGVCTGDENYVAGSCYDCNGIPYGIAYEDVCGCVGGNTGLPDAFKMEIDSLYLEIATSVQNFRIPVNVSNVDSLDSFYMELDYDSTGIQIVDISKDGDINNDNYDKLVHYDSIINNTSFNKRVIFNLFYSPKTDCSQYSDDETVCKENNGDCFWNDNTVKCEQNQFANECASDSTDVMFKIKLNTNELETSVVTDTTSISIHNLVLNENSLDTVWPWDIIISDSQGCMDDGNQTFSNWPPDCVVGGDPACVGACNYNSNASVPDNNVCEYPPEGDCDCDGNVVDECNICGGNDNNGNDICEIICPPGEEPDCNNDCGGSAYIDSNCGEDFCAGGNTDRECVENCSDLEEECTGSDSYWDGTYCWNGDAYLDYCEQCIAGSEDIDCFSASFRIYNSSGLEEDDSILKGFENFYVALYMQNVPDSLEGIIVNLGFDIDILSLDDWSINPNELDIEGGTFGLTGELGSSYMLEGGILDTTFGASIKLNTNEFYQENGGNMLFLQFSILGTNGESTLISYNEIQINEHVMQEHVNYTSTSQVIYIGDCNGVFNGEMLLDECGECGGDGIPEGECDCEGNTPEDLYEQCVGVDCDCEGNLSINESLIPQNYTLSQNYPNPFNPITYINYSVPNYDFITIDIINISGQIIKTIVQSSHQPGNYEIMWDGTNYYGISVPSGIYFYKMDADEFVSVKKLVLLK